MNINFGIPNDHYLVFTICWSSLQAEAGPIVKSYLPVSVEVGQTYPVIVSHVVSPAQIWCQRDTDCLDQLMEEIKGNHNYTMYWYTIFTLKS